MAKDEVKKKRSAKVASENIASAQRTRKLTWQQVKAQAKKEAQTLPPIPNSFKLTLEAGAIIRRFWKPLGGIMLVYLLLLIIFAGGLSNFSTTFDSVKQNGTEGLIGSLSTSSSSTSSVQMILIIMESLVIIWALRQLLAGRSIGVKQAYYQSMAPLIPFLLVAGLIIIQLLPVTFGSKALALIFSSISPPTALLAFFLLVFVSLLASWSIYMISSSLFALYIVTLPNMQPRQALRSAKNIVRFRRWAVIRRVLFLPLLLLVAAVAIITPLILLAPILVLPAFYVLALGAFLFAHTYLYSLYKGLIA